MKKYLLLILLCPLSLAAKTIVVNTIGYGSDIRSATKDALVSAISQTNSASITTNQASVVNESSNNENSNLKTNMNDQFTLSANGIVKRYQIQSENCEENKCVVKIKAYVKESKMNKLDDIHRKKIVLEMAKSSQLSHFHSALESNFTRGGGKFAVIDQGVEDQMDYIIELSLVQANTHSWKKDHRTRDPLTGEIDGKISTYFSSTYAVKYRILSGDTRQVKYAGQQKTTSNRNNLSHLAELTASKVYQDINNALFPMRIASVYPDDGEITIPTDGKIFTPGMRFKVETSSRAERDPYTNEIIGYRTKKVGEIEITQVERKVMYAKVIHGDINQIKAKMIVKPLHKKQQLKTKLTSPKKRVQKTTSSHKKDSAVVDTSGGIILN